ncbi:MAG: MATE family efflux transporter, partial [Eubacteriales bacterium]|nr:MATE family efflux transporter [Eubacteriales bacterium]
SISSTLTLLYQALAFGAAMGVSVVVSRLFGAGKEREVRAAVSTAMIAAALFCALLTVLGLLGSGALLRLIRTPAEVFLHSKQYLLLYTIGLLSLFLYQISLGVFAALGDAKTPSLFLTLSSLVNIALDLLFVVRFRLGVAGIAFATLLCQASSAIIALAILAKRLRGMQSKGYEERAVQFSRPLLQEMLQIALPVTLQQLIVSMGNVLIQANVNNFGSGVSAGYAAAIKMNNMAISALMAFDKGMATFAAQNIGAKKPERIRSGRNAAVLLSVSFGVTIAALFFVFRADLLRLFLGSGSAEAMLAGEQFFLIVIPFYLFVSVKIACDGALRGLGAMRQLLTGTFVDLSLRVGCGFLFSAIWGPVGIWAAWPVGWITGTALSAAFTANALRATRIGADAGSETH